MRMLQVSGFVTLQLLNAGVPSCRLHLCSETTPECSSLKAELCGMMWVLQCLSNSFHILLSAKGEEKGGEGKKTKRKKQPAQRLPSTHPH